MSHFDCPPDASGKWPLPHILSHAPDGAEIQVLTAWALARAFGHGWAFCADEHDAEPVLSIGYRNFWPARVPMSWDAANAAYAAASAAAGPDHDVGIPPAADHETASGRVRWRVSVDGAVEADICRPAGSVCGLRRDGEIWRTSADYRLGNPEKRHLVALLWVMEPIGHPRSAEIAAVLDLFAAANAAMISTLAKESVNDSVMADVDLGMDDDAPVRIR